MHLELKRLGEDAHAATKPANSKGVRRMRADVHVYVRHGRACRRAHVCAAWACVYTATGQVVGRGQVGSCAGPTAMRTLKEPAR